MSGINPKQYGQLIKGEITKDDLPYCKTEVPKPIIWSTGKSTYMRGSREPYLYKGETT